jgi:hypothetical protein
MNSDRDLKPTSVDPTGSGAPAGKSLQRPAGFIELHAENIRILCHTCNSLIDPTGLIAEVKRILIKIEMVLGITCGEIEIEVYRNKKEWVERHTLINEGDLPSWVQGDSGRVMRLVMDEVKIASMEDLTLMVAHECVHAAVRKHTGERCPAWLDEGLSTYLTQELPEAYAEAFKQALAADALLPLEMLTASFCRLDRKIKCLAYAQSHSLVDFLVAKYGWKIVKDLLAAYSRGDSEDGVLRKHGLNMYLLEKEWMREIKGSQGSRARGSKREE